MTTRRAFLAAMGAAWAAVQPVTARQDDEIMATAVLSGDLITDAVRLAGVDGDGRSAPDSSVGIWPATTNLDPNPNAAAGVTGWSGVNGSLSASSEQIRFGTTAFKLVSTTTGSCWMVQTTITGSPVTQRSYARSCWVYGTAAIVGKTCQLQLNEAGGAAATAYFAIDTVTLIAGWQRITCHGIPAEADRTSIVTLLTLHGSVSGDTIYAGGFQIEEGVRLASPFTASSRVAGRVQLPATHLSPERGMVAVRARIDWSDASPDTAYLWRWADDATHELSLRLAGGFARMRRASPDGSVEAIAVCIPNDGEEVTITGRWTPTGVSVSVDGDPFAAGLTSVLSDSFTRADTVSGIGTADTGQTWGLTGSGVGHIASNRFAQTAPNDGGATSGNVYAYLNDIGSPIRMSSLVSWHARGSNGGIHVLICSPNPNAALTDMIHFYCTFTGWGMQTRVGNEVPFTSIGGGTLTGLVADGTLYEMAMVIDAPRNRIHLTLPDGTTAVVAGSAVSACWGPHLIYEIGGKLTELEPRFDDVTAEIDSGASEAAGAFIPEIVNTFVDIGSAGDGTGLLNGDVLWVAAGRGRVTNSDVQRIAAFDDTTQRIHALPADARMTMLWTADDAAVVAKLPTQYVGSNAVRRR